MPAKKPLGERSKIAHSLLCYCIEHPDYRNPALIYNGWVYQVARVEGFKIESLDMKKFILEQIDANLNTPLDHLIVCRDIEEGQWELSNT